MDSPTSDVMPPECNKDAGSASARSSKIQRRWAIKPLGYSSLALPNVRIELIGESPDADKGSIRRSWARLRDRLRRGVNALL